LTCLAADSGPYWPLGLYLAAVVLTVAAILLLSHLMGQRHRERATGMPYESGMIPTGSARLRFSADFYLVVMFFVIFDLESVFIFAWAVAAKELGWAGYAAAMSFTAVLLATLLYLWRVGALDWGKGRGRKKQLPIDHLQLTIEKKPPARASSKSDVSAVQ
jgi:NADH-quinone oxidoreductase subunit A